jgi:hypothetical protein
VSIELRPSDQDAWLLATGDLPQPLLVRFEYRGDRLRLTGLRLESGQPITAAVLRDIPVGELVEAYVPHLRQQFQNVRRQMLESDASELGASHQRFTELLEPMLKIATSGDAAVLTASRGPGAKPPSAAEYRAFAQMYAEELTSRGERGALSRTAKRWGVHRSTALRWLRSMPRELLEGEDHDQS